MHTVATADNPPDPAVVYIKCDIKDTLSRDCKPLLAQSEKVLMAAAVLVVVVVVVGVVAAVRIMIIVVVVVLLLRF